MRELYRPEINKRGCLFCADKIKKRGIPKSFCKYAKCPYRELDPYKTYFEYLKSPRQNLLEMVLERLMNPERRR